MNILPQNDDTELLRDDDDLSARSEATAYCLAHIDALIGDVRQYMIMAKARGDDAAHLDWRGQHERLIVARVEQENCKLGWQDRETAHKLGNLVMPDLLDETRQEAARAHDRAMQIEAAAEAAEAETLDAEGAEAADGERRLGALSRVVGGVSNDDDRALVSAIARWGKRSAS